jgi:predicted RNA-binding protein with PUA-like domain
MSTKRYWLMKSEPEVFSIDDLKKNKTTWWECVRNYQARNFMLHDMHVGDEVLFYHSSAEPPGVAGTARVCAEASADQTQFDKKSEYYDAKSDKANPRWQCVQVEFVEKFARVIPLAEIRETASLRNMPLLQKGQRLSIQPVSESEFSQIKKMGKA